MIKRLLSITGLLVIALLTVIGSTACSKTEPEPITFGTVLLEPSLPLFVAENQNYFVKNGLNVTFKIYDVGLNAATGLVNGEVDMASPVAEYVMVGKIFDNKPIQAIASIDKVDYAYVVGRKDHGITQISDLKGKKIGVVRGTILEFQLARFLELNGVLTSDVTLVYGTLPQSESALKNGEIDAVMSIPPFTTGLQNQLGEGAALWAAQSSQPFYSLVLAGKEWIKQHPNTVGRFVKAMKQAEDFMVNNPDETKAILKNKLNFSEAEITRVWSQNVYRLTMEQSLLLAMEDEARWMIKSNLVKEKEVPNFLDNIYEKALKEVAPESVNIIR